MKQAAKLLTVIPFCALLSACALKEVRLDNPDQQNPTKPLEAADANIQLGIAYLQQDEVPQAKSNLLQAVQEAPNLPASWYALGYFSEVTGQIKLANTYYKRALALNPHSGDSLNNYGTFLCRTGKPKMAIKEFSQAVAQPAYLQTASAYENAGLCALTIPNKKLATHFFQEALMNNPNLTTSLLQLAKLDFQYKDFNASNLALKRFLKLHKATQTTRQLSLQLATVNKIDHHRSAAENSLKQRFRQMPKKA
jgi:type IV pilus assembly protein PilF